MKSLRLMLPVVLISLTTLAFAQHDAQNSPDKVAPSEAQKSFDQLKNLAGVWQGPVTVDPPQEDVKAGELGQVSLRVTSRGNALVHEMQEAGTPLDATKY